MPLIVVAESLHHIQFICKLFYILTRIEYHILEYAKALVRPIKLTTWP